MDIMIGPHHGVKSSVDQWEFQSELREFMLENQYEKDGWPHMTVLLCQCSAETNSGESIPITFPPLMRFNNNPGEVHAVLVMKNYLQSKLEHLPPECKVKLSMILSYSPCNNCSMTILDFKERRKEKQKLLEFSIEIKFSNFRKCYSSNDINVEGLHRLINNDVKLSVFCERNDWIWFIRDKLGLDPGLVDDHYTKKRKDREFVDTRILQDIKSYPAEYDARHDEITERFSSNVRSFFDDESVNQWELRRELHEFMLENKYGVFGPGIRWPHTTVLLCQCSAETNSGESIPITFPSLMRFDNIQDEDIHAEQVMLKYLHSKFQLLPPKSKVRLSMILSYSPCNDCSKTILKFIKDEHKLLDFSIEIKFSTFYKCYKSHDSNVKGLYALIKKNIQISVFCGINDCIWFICDKLGLDPNLVDAHYTKKRKDRESVDLRILQVIKSQAKYDSSLDLEIARISCDM